MKEKFYAFLKANEGTTFYTVTGLPFTYELRQNGMYISRVRDIGEYTFSYENIYRALEKMPIPSVASLTKDVRGPSYCYAIISKFAQMQYK